MTQKHRAAQYIIDQAKGMYSTAHYVGNKDSRTALANLYSSVMNIGIDYPARTNTQTYLPSSLKRKVSRTCPSCVHPTLMTKRVNEAKEYISNYAKVLQKMLDDEQGTAIETKSSVHDMKSNIND